MTKAKVVFKAKSKMDIEACVKYLKLPTARLFKKL